MNRKLVPGMEIRKLLIVALFFIIGVGNVFATHRIMPLGDSITRGMGGDPPYTGYRDDLYQKLINAGWDFDFVGSQSDGSGFDADHEGHGGWHADDILANIDTWLLDSTPDVILLHIGTNDVSSGEPNSQTISEIEGILDKIYAYNSQTSILLCKLIPRIETPANEYLQNQDLNAKIEELYNTKKNQGFYIYLVDQYSAFTQNDNWRTEYMIDNVHPTDAGYAVMADTYFSVLQSIHFPTLTLTIQINPEGAGTVLLDPDREKYAYSEVVQMRAVAYGEFHFDHWSGDIDVNSTNPINIYMLHSRTIIANFVNDEEEFVSTPNTPTGPANGYTGESLTFSTGGSTSNLGHDVEYKFDWGDGGQSGWGSPTQSHVFGINGIFQIKAQARCSVHTNIKSAWSNFASVTINGDTTFILTVIVNPLGAGEVVTSPEKLAYEPKETVTLHAVPANENFDFQYWSGDIDSSTINPVTIYMLKNRTIIANFHSSIPYYTLDIGIDPDGAGTVTKNPDKLSYAEGETVELTAQAASSATDKIYIEGENGTLFGAMRVGDDLTASGGQFVYDTSSHPKSGYAEYTFDVQESGSYAIWGRCYALSGTEDSFFIVVDGSPDTLTWHLDSHYYSWRWQKVSDWYTVKEFNLDVGSHTITLVSRDVNARLDKFILSKDPTFVPSGKEENAGGVYAFDSWYGDLTGSQNPVTVVMNSNKAITAHFSETHESVTTPNKPTGPTSGEVGMNLTFSTGGSQSALGNPVEYQFDFGDGNLSSWGGDTRTHAYVTNGTFELKARARSQTFTQVVSDWSSGLSVTISEIIQYNLTVHVIPDGSGSIDKNPSKSVYDPAEWVRLMAIPKTKDDNIRVEAESGALSGNMAVGSDDEASDNQYIYGTSRDPGSGSAEIQFEVSEFGTYFIWGRCYALSSTEDSFFLIVDNSSDTLTWHLDPEYYNAWKWQKVSDWHVEQTFDLTPGWHTLTIVTRDINARLDNLLITSDPTYQPAGKEEYNSNIRLEAESGNYASPFTTGTDPQASGNYYLYSTSSTPMSATASYGVDIPSSGTYYIWGRCYALSGTEDSFFFQMDDQSVLTWHLDPEYHVWKWQKVSHNHVVQSFNLSKGQHSLKVISRDVNARLDKLLLTTNPNYVPSGKEDTPSAVDANYRFDRWEGDISGNSNPVNIQMSGDKEIYAYFVVTQDFISPPTSVVGPETGMIGQPLSFMASGASSEQGNSLQYQFDWGDGTMSPWGADTQDHIYNSSGTKTVKARAKSAVDTTSISNWGDNVQVVNIIGLSLSIAVDPVGSGTVGKSPSKPEYAYDDTVTLTPSAISGYAFDHWNGDLTGSETPAQLIMTGNKAVTAVFVESQETVTQPNKPTGPTTGILGQTLQFAVTGSSSNLGHELQYQFDWGDGSLSEWGLNLQNHVYSVTGIMSIKARARCKTHTNVISDWSDTLMVTVTGYILTITVSPTDKGLVTKNPNKNKYGFGEKVAVSAIGTSGYQFDHWEGDLTGTTNPDTVTLNGNRSIIAFFKQTQETVSMPMFIASPDTGYLEHSIAFTTGGSVSSFGNAVQYQFDWGDGTLSAWGDSAASHIYNLVGTHKVKARARSAANNSIVSDWTDGKPIVILSVYYSISVTIDPESAGSVNRTPFKSRYRDGDVVILTPLPISGYVFDDWTGDLEGIDNPAIIQIDGNKNITAHFRTISSVDKQKKQIPDNFSLSQNYPNPFNPGTSINYQLAQQTHVLLKVYNMQGQLIETLVSETQPAGFYTIRWKALDGSGRRLPSGVYLYRIETDYFSELKKMILMK
ncbi:MAG: PKD domain-containing protein [Calditrichaeota bacterium]|nr:PKD domain-containing protein [Calditrichota bacterium]